MNVPLAAQVLFALIVGAGLWLLGQGGWGLYLTYSASGRAKGRMQPGLKGNPAGEGVHVSVLPEMPLAQRLISPVLIDLGLWLFANQDHASVEERLRRSGWRYTS